MKLKKTNAHPLDKSKILRSIKFSKNHSLYFNNLPYSLDILSRDGANLDLYVSRHTSEEDIRKALIEAYQSNDIINHQTYIVPSEWLTELI